MRRPRPARPLLVALCLALGWLAVAASAKDRHVAVLVDTSGSMQSNDHQRYTMQLSQILSDLLDVDDALTVVRMGSNRCSAGPSSALALRLNPHDRDEFKRRLEAHTEFNTGTHYPEAVRTAIEALATAPDKERMLLILADSGGLGTCEQVLTSDLLALRDSGATVAAVNLGSTAGAFDANPAFNFTTAALDAEELVAAVALVYQRFLGNKQVQTGRVAGAIQVEIAPYVKEAYLVVAADGPIGELRQAAGNPAVDAIDLNLHGGGETRGVDGRIRGYRIARLQRPSAGRWTFDVPDLSDAAGWMLLQDSSVALRLLSPPTIAQGVATPLEVEVYDQNTGERIDDLSQLPDLELSFEVGGRPVPLRDDGTGGDRQAGDGILTGTATFDELGDQRIAIRMENDLLDRTMSFEAEVVEAAWQLRVTTPGRVEVGSPVVLGVELAPLGALASLTAPERIDAMTGGPVIALRDDGTGGDAAAGDRIYSATWTPQVMGTLYLDYAPRGGTAAPQVSAPLEVVGGLEFGPPIAVELGRVASESEASGRLDLSSATVKGTFEVAVHSPFAVERTVLEIDFGDGWVTLDDEPRTVELHQAGGRGWPLRLRVGGCPGAHPASAVSEIVIEAAGEEGPRRLVVPLRVEVVPDPWLVCWWPLLALITGLAITGVVIHGFWVPSRFPSRLGVVLSPEEDVEEGFFHPIRAQRGSGSGFYRDAQIYVCADFRLSSKPRGAVARLRADGSQVRIQPLLTLGRRTADDEWEKLPPEETPMRFGTLYRNDLKTLFFELRNG